jgi:hypothetical protein
MTGRHGLDAVERSAAEPSAKKVKLGIEAEPLWKFCFNFSSIWQVMGPNGLPDTKVGTFSHELYVRHEEGRLDRDQHEERLEARRRLR